jgi:hypothetical protein
MAPEFNEFSSLVSSMVDEIGEDFVRIRFEITAKGGRLVGIREDGQQVRSNVYKGFALNRWREVEETLSKSCTRPFEVILHFN